MRLNDLGTGKLECPKLRPEIIIIRPLNNYRDMQSAATKAHIEWLKESIREEGVKKPVDVEFIDGKVYLVAGECRLTAAQQLRQEGWDGFIPALSVKGDEADILARSMIDNGGLPPTMLEFGAAVRRLQKFGWELERIAKYVPVHIAETPSRALRFVQDALELDQAPLAVKEAVRDGVDGVAVSPALAVAVTRKNRIQAAEIIKDEVAKAKAAGKTEAKRPKGAGKATKAKAVAADHTDKLMKLGDRMAAGLLTTESIAWDKLEALAKQWAKLRAE
jgi:ParB-like chromosome segregation protein Spo0J